MPLISNLLLLGLSLGAPAAHAEARFEPAITVIKYCEFLNDRLTLTYSKFTEDQRPPSWQFWAKDEFEAGARSLTDFLTRSRKMQGFIVLAQHVGEAQADLVRIDCLKRKIEWSELFSRFSGLGGMAELGTLNTQMGGSFSPMFKAEVQKRIASDRAVVVAREYDEKSKTILELGRYKFHLVTVSVSATRCLYPLSLGSSDSDREDQLLVPRAKFNQLPIGEVEPGWGWSTVTPLRGTDDRGPCRLSVQHRRIEISNYILNDQEKVIRVSESEWNLYLAALKRRQARLAESQIGDHHKIVVVKMDSAKTSDRPLKRYYITLRPSPRELGQLFQEYQSPVLSSTVEFEFSDLDMRVTDPRIAVGRRLREFLIEPSWLAHFDDIIVAVRVVEDKDLAIDNNQFVHLRASRP